MKKNEGRKLRRREKFKKSRSFIKHAANVNHRNQIKANKEKEK